jgi:hypothetical protein
MFIPVSTQASPAAMELALKLTNVIREYQQTRSDVTSRDIRHALRMTELSTGAGAPRVIILGAVMLALAAGLILALYTGGGARAGAPPSTMMPMLLIALVIALFVVVRLVRR